MRRFSYFLIVMLALTSAGCGMFNKTEKKSKSKKPAMSRQMTQAKQAEEEEARQAAAREEETRRLAEIRSYLEQGKQDIEAAVADDVSNRTVELDMVDDRTMRLTVNNAAIFDVGGVTLKKSAGKMMHKLAEAVAQVDKTNVSVVGHTDNSGKAETNLALSQKRADSVMSWFIKHGVLAERISAEGRGDQEPRDTNATKEGRATNRRIELWLRYTE